MFSLSLLAYFTHTVMRTRCMRRRAICTRTKNEAYFIARASPWKRPSNKFALILDYVNSDPVHTIPGIFKIKIMWEGLYTTLESGIKGTPSTSVHCGRALHRNHLL